ITDQLASELYVSLRKKNYSVFVDHLSIKPGSNWVISVDNVLKSSNTFLVLIPPNGIENSYYSQTEIVSALELAKAFPGKYKVIPVYIAGLPKDFNEI